MAENGLARDLDSDEKWKHDFSVACDNLSQQLPVMIHEELYLFPEVLLRWAEEAAKKGMAVSEAFHGSYVAMDICDGISHRPSADDVFKKIIEFGRELGIEPQINSESLKILTFDVINRYLDDKGLVRHESVGYNSGQHG